MIDFVDGAHWYTKEGKSAHDSNLTIARGLGLYMSVTTVDKEVFPNHFLNKWSKNQLAKAAAENPRMVDEPIEEYVNRIYQISIEKSTKAAAFGKELHDAIEHYPNQPGNPAILPFYQAMVPWIESNINQFIHQEKIVLDHDIGVAGMMDVYCVYNGRLAVLDWKTQDVKKDDKGRKKPAFYDSWKRQLSFYAATLAKEHGVFPDIATCVSVVIDSNEPGPPFVREWDLDTMRKAYRQFVVGAWQYCSSRGKGGYWPGRFGEWHPTLDPIPTL